MSANINPPNFVRQCYVDRRDSGGMFKAEVGVQEVTTTKENRFRAYVQDSWGGVAAYRDTEQEAMSEIDRLWKKLFG